MHQYTSNTTNTTFNPPTHNTQHTIHQLTTHHSHHSQHTIHQLTTHHSHHSQLTIRTIHNSPFTTHHSYHSHHSQGGHCGFDADPSRSYVHGPVEPPAHGWIAEELSRCIDHIHKATKPNGTIAAASAAASATMGDGKQSSAPMVLSSSTSSFMSSLFPPVTTAEPSVISTLFSSTSSKKPSSGGSNQDIHRWFGGLSSPSVQRYRSSSLIPQENEQSGTDTWSWTDNK